jgi:hypothetical protein
MAVLAAGTMKSTTLENNALEAALRLQAAEAAYIPATGVTKPNKVQISINDDTGIATVSMQLQVSRTFEATGAITYTAAEYL